MPEPISTGTAILGSAVLGGLASSKAASTQADAARAAADAQLQAAREANALQQRIYEENRARMAPAEAASAEDYNKLRALAYGGLPAAQELMTSDPGYAFGLSEGLKAQERAAAARGQYLSGGALKASGRYATDYATTKFGEAAARRERLAGMYPSLLGAQTRLGEQYGQQASQNLLAGGQAAAQGYLGAAGARSSGYIGGANALAGGLGQYLNYTQNQALLNRLPYLMGGGGGGGGSYPIIPDTGSYTG